MLNGARKQWKRLKSFKETEWNVSMESFRGVNWQRHSKTRREIVVAFNFHLNNQRMMEIDHVQFFFDSFFACFLLRLLTFLRYSNCKWLIEIHLKIVFSGTVRSCTKLTYIRYAAHDCLIASKSFFCRRSIFHAIEHDDKKNEKGEGRKKNRTEPWHCMVFWIPFISQFGWLWSAEK